MVLTKRVQEAHLLLISLLLRAQDRRLLETRSGWVH